MTTTIIDSFSRAFRPPTRQVSLSRFLAQGRAAEAEAATPKIFQVTEDTLQPASVDRANGILRGVRICGLVSKNCRKYSSAALKAAVPLYEGCQVGVDHADNGPRSYVSRFGVLKHVRFVEGDGLRGDLHFPPNHQLAEQVCFDAEHHAPVGLSHDVDAKTSRAADGTTTIDSIRSVRSVDIVARPATNRTFFESVTPRRDALARILEGEPATESRTFAAVRRINRDSLSLIFK
jgi:hypothetical protein